MIFEPYYVDDGGDFEVRTITSLGDVGLDDVWMDLDDYSSMSVDCCYGFEPHEGIEVVICI